jgi:hypothetical protein
MTTLRGPGVKSVGKPDAGNRHVRFEERGRETGLLTPRPSSTLPDKSLKTQQPCQTDPTIFGRRRQKQKYP